MPGAGMMWPSGVTGSAGFSGGTISSIKILNGPYTTLTYDPYADIKLKIEGSVRSAALAIFQEAERQKTDNTYSYNGKTVVPAVVHWGPFMFKTDGDQFFDPILSGDLKYHELGLIYELMGEIVKLKSLRGLL